MCWFFLYPKFNVNYCAFTDRENYPFKRNEQGQATRLLLNNALKITFLCLLSFAVNWACSVMYVLAIALEVSRSKWFYYMASWVSSQDEPNRALWYSTWQDGAFMPVRDYPTYPPKKKKKNQKPYNKSFLDHACSVKMAEYWPGFFFCEFMDLHFVWVHKHAKKEFYLDLTPGHVTNP